MHLIIGLGNPGKQYEKNRHNVGFMVVDEIAKQHGAVNFTKKFNSNFALCEINGSKIALIKPNTFMNLSGKSVLESTNFYKIPSTHVIVIHDELDIDSGRIKTKVGGGSAGHNGIKSIDSVIGNEYTRIRIGISRPKHATEVSNYVLQDFNLDELPYIACAQKSISKHLSTLIAGDLSKFMNNCALELNELENA